MKLTRFKIASVAPSNRAARVLVAARSTTNTVSARRASRDGRDGIQIPLLGLMLEAGVIRRRPVSTKQQRKSVRAGEIVTRHLEPVLGNETGVLAVGGACPFPPKSSRSATRAGMGCGLSPTSR
jgi:hypothetical protein